MSIFSNSYNGYYPSQISYIKTSVTPETKCRFWNKWASLTNRSCLSDNDVTQNKSLTKTFVLSLSPKGSFKIQFPLATLFSEWNLNICVAFNAFKEVLRSVAGTRLHSKFIRIQIKENEKERYNYSVKKF